MRLQLSCGTVGLLTVLLLAMRGEAAAGAPRSTPAPRVTVTLREGLYQDSNATTVNTSAVSVGGLPHRSLALSGQYLVDAVSSASVDVITQATGRFRDIRHEGATGVFWDDGANRASARYAYSRENDWQSHNAYLTWSRDLLAHNLTLGASAGYQWNDIWRSHSAGFSEKLQTALGMLWLDAVLTKRDLLQIVLAPMFHAGFQSSPYRYLFIDDQAVLEDHPRRRFRQALVLRHVRHVLRDSAVETHVRGYVDTWGIGSGTAGVEYLHGLGDVTLSGFVRGYGQSGARFWRAEYDQVSTYVSFDKEASPFVDVFAGGRFQWARTRTGTLSLIRVDARLVGNYFHYFRFPNLTDRGGVTAEIGLTLGF